MVLGCTSGEEDDVRARRLKEGPESNMQRANTPEPVTIGKITAVEIGREWENGERSAFLVKKESENGSCSGVLYPSKR